MYVAIPKKTSKSKVIQRVWIYDESSKTAYWKGRSSTKNYSTLREGYTEVDPPPLFKYQPPRHQTGGFLQEGGKKRMVVSNGQTLFNPYDKHSSFFNPKTADDTSSYFGGQLKIYHQGFQHSGRQYHGAAFPRANTSFTLSVSPHKVTSWTQTTFPPQETPRRPERTIMHGSASSAICAAGITPQPFSSWSHLQPDHTHPINREDPANRTPTYFEANQKHTVLEIAARKLQQKYGDFEIRRELIDPIDSTGLYYCMRATFILTVNGQKFEFFTDIPNYSHMGGRYGDAEAIVLFIDTEIQKALRR